MSDNTYDELARVLRELHGRFGAEAFSNRRRLTGLMADRLPDAKLEIRVVLDAIDDGVATELANTAPDQLGVQIDRLGARQESRRGIRAEIARAAVCACAYGLGLGPLPSQFQGNPRTATTPSSSSPNADWVGSTVVAGAQSDMPTPPTAAPAMPHAPAPAGKFGLSPAALKRYGAAIAITGVVVVIAVNQFIGNDDSPRDAPAPAPVAPAPVARDVERRDGEQPMPPPPPRTQTAPNRDTTPAVQPPAPPAAQEPVAVTPPPRPNAPPAQTPQRRAPQGGFADELRDFGVPATRTLQSNVSSPTPASIPGARVISTVELIQALGSNSSLLLFDVLSNPYAETLPGSRSMLGAGTPGQFNDNIQWQFSNALQQVTGGRKDVPLVFFCSGPGCWMSYNASLRAAAAGFQNVLWYRGGIAAWRAAGQPLSPLSQ